MNDEKVVLPVVEEIETENVVDQVTEITPTDDPENTVIDISDALVEELQNDDIEVKKVADTSATKCVISDNEKHIIIGGVDEKGLGFMLKKYDEGESPYLTVGSTTVIDKLFIDYDVAEEELPYVIIAAGRTINDQVVVIRCTSELDIINAVILEDQPAPVTAIAKWNGVYQIAVTHTANNGINSPAIITMESDLTCSVKVMINLEIPKDFVMEDSYPTGIIAGFVPSEDRLIFAGYMANNSGQGFGFISAIDAELKTIRSLTITDPTMKSATVRSVTVDKDGTLNLVVILSDPSTEPKAIVYKLDHDLNPIAPAIMEPPISESVN